ncbi:N-acetyl-gamma-glutamyl-phosphate reductase [Cohaesibacter sp. CAU 1516]|uniref:N-acetyl-gamma-glutamyl-phosphate reductase n=1 Tax=Cohaesibacter sp. CAU 1516 TaxID=2576038 RepID=UPI0010FF24DC|nr:N-acetyl-gamma-glutamyl-phosphate reductase [Cohaesibacter sp. CAU 1516]TLP46948.1 N-acetyl-gamma-glutamyl-phosphate reductase [Cohaesibacter sp. CAU 1516]
MVAKLFIDGEVGTTGLQIRTRLEGRNDIKFLRLPDNLRKDAEARAQMLNEADIAILCLPDAAAIEAVSLIENKDTRVIDASSAHRTAEGWTYGFAELSKGQRAAIAEAKRVSNPGCYPQGYLAIMRPLVEAGLIPANFPATLNAISGYSGGGKGMIADYESNENPIKVPYWPYGLTLAHKHVPEMQAYSGLEHPPVFQPAVGTYAQGMIGAIPLNLWALDSQPKLADLHACLADRYADEIFVKVAPLEAAGKLDAITPEHLNGTNSLHLHVHGNDEIGQAVLLAVYDNLGKGASGAAVQNMNIMMGIDETTGLDIAPL